MLRKTSLIFLVIIALFLLLTACGIPQMFPWSDDQYDLTDSSLSFDVRFSTVHYKDGKPHTKDWILDFKEGTPIIRIYYMLRPNQESSGSSLISRFNSNFRESFPPTYSSGVAAATVNISSAEADDGYVATSLYEMRIAPADSPSSSEPVSDYMIGESFFIPKYNSSGEAESYSASWSITAEPFSGDESGSGFNLILHWNGGRDNGGEDYILTRMNGRPFYLSSALYCDDPRADDLEFIKDDQSGLTNMELRVYLTASFAFDGYTTKATIPIDYNTPIFIDSQSFV